MKRKYPTIAFAILLGWLCHAPAMAQTDFAITGISSPPTSTTLVMGQSYTVRINISNTTASSGFTSFQLLFTIDGTNFLNETKSWNYGPNGTTSHTFQTQYLVESQGGIATATLFTSDDNPSNNNFSHVYGVTDPPIVGIDDPVEAQPAFALTYQPQLGKVYANIPNQETSQRPQLVIYDLVGNEVQAPVALQPEQSATYSANVAPLAPGFYVLRVIDSQAYPAKTMFLNGAPTR